jgi:hypothetical protein
VPKLRLSLKGGLQTFGHYGTRVRCQKLAPQRGLNFGTPRYRKVLNFVIYLITFNIIYINIIMKNIICFLTVTPTKEFYDFATKLQDDNYDVYICIDRNDYKIPEYDSKIPIIQINNIMCEFYGFKNTVFYFKNKACARDKALYYFAMVKKEFKNLWLIEEDVFIPTLNIIQDIDIKYPDGDLLTSSNTMINTVKQMSNWHWKNIKNDIKLPFPWSCSMICACRISPKLLQCIHNYAKMYKTLFLDEALFNTICDHNNLTILVIEELAETITYKNIWTVNEINKNHLYHPVKNIKEHDIFRKHLEIQ